MNLNLVRLAAISILTLCLPQCNPFTATKSNSVMLTTKEYFDARRDRKIKTYIWQPSDSKLKNDKSMPLILFSHGNESSSANYTWFTVALAEKGFMVAGIDHYNNTWYNHTPIGAVSLWERPQDVTFVLTRLLEDHSFSNMINKNKIAVAGHSAGGYTVLALAGAIYKIELMRKYRDNYLDYNIGKDVSRDFFKNNINNAKRPYKDNRIKAAFAMDPGLGGGIENDSLKRITIPVLIVGSKQNDFLSYEDNAFYYSKYIPKSKLTTLDKGEGHFVFLDTCTPYGKLILRQICIDRKGINRDEIHKEIFETAYRFFIDSL